MILRIPTSETFFCRGDRLALIGWSAEESSERGPLVVRPKVMVARTIEYS